MHQEFADDIIIDTAHSNSEVVARRLTDATSKLANWLDSIGLLLNKKKTQAMFVKPRGLTDISVSVHCNGEALQVISSANYLGITIDDDLSWKSHLEHLFIKSRKATGRLWSHCKARSIKAKRTWYLSMIQAKLSYGSNAFFPALTADGWDRLSKIAKAGVRAVLGLHNPVRTKL